jgi:hypothetical protein
LDAFAQKRLVAEREREREREKEGEREREREKEGEREKEREREIVKENAHIKTRVGWTCSASAYSLLLPALASIDAAVVGCRPIIITQLK